jgi:hypothetical protein
MAPTTVIDYDYLAEQADSLPDLLAHMHRLARLLELTVLGQIHERDIDGLAPQDGDADLVRDLVWPLEAACRRAIELERAARPPEPPGDGKLEILDGGRT